jgi:hypothetical protein
VLPFKNPHPIAILLCRIVHGKCNDDCFFSRRPIKPFDKAVIPSGSHLADAGKGREEIKPFTDCVAANDIKIKK